MAKKQLTYTLTVTITAPTIEAAHRLRDEIVGGGNTLKTDDAGTPGSEPAHNPAGTSEPTDDNDDDERSRDDANDDEPTAQADRP